MLEDTQARQHRATEFAVAQLQDNRARLEHRIALMEKDADRSSGGTGARPVDGQCAQSSRGTAPPLADFGSVTVPSLTARCRLGGRCRGLNLCFCPLFKRSRIAPSCFGPNSVRGLRRNKITMFLPSRFGLATTLLPEPKYGPDTMADAARSNSESLKKLYHDMLLIRRFEERAGQLYGMGRLAASAVYRPGGGGGQPDGRGQKIGRPAGRATIAITATCWRENLDPRAVMADTGRRPPPGLSRGKGGSMLCSSAEKRLWRQPHGIV